VVFNKSIYVVLDSGASLSIISVDYLLQHGVDPASLGPSKRPAVAANGKLLDFVGTYTVTVKVGDKDIKVVCEVARNFGYALLLGNDFLHANKSILDFKTSTVTIRDVKLPLLFNTPVQAGDFIPVRSPTSERFPARTVSRFSMPVDAPEGVNVLLRAARSKHARGTALTSPTGLHTVKDGCILLEVLNPSDEPLRFAKGQVIAVLEFLDEDVANLVSDVLPADTSTDVPVADRRIPLPAVKVDPALTPDQRAEFDNLVRAYRDVFAADPKNPGTSSVAEHYIDTAGAAPRRQPVRRTNPTEQDFIDNEVDSLLKNGMAVPSTSAWAAPVVLVKKKDGTLRFCIDYRQLNSVTTKTVAPLPRIDDALDALGGSSWFSSLDLASGYWQLRVAEQDRHKTAFITRKGLFEFKVMPFGLTGAVATFQNAMNIALSGLTWNVCLCYLDDVLVFSKSFDEHLEHLRLIFDRFRDHKLHLRADKCVFCARRTKYLGHLVQAGGISPDPALIDKIVNAKSPTNLTEVRAFNNLATYYHRFVHHFSTISYPLNRLTHKNVKFEWTDACEASFQAIKKAVTSAPTLRFPDFKRGFVLLTDASDHAVSGVLSQVFEDGEHPIGFYSKTMDRAEHNYDTTNREGLAVVRSIVHYRHYLEYQRFTLITDHQALSTLMDFKNPTGRLSRWIMFLQQFNFEIKHRPGRLHGAADAMTRTPIAPVPDYTDAPLDDPSFPDDFESPDEESFVVTSETPIDLSTFDTPSAPRPPPRRLEGVPTPVLSIETAPNSSNSSAASGQASQTTAPLLDSSRHEELDHNSVLEQFQYEQQLDSTYCQPLIDFISTGHLPLSIRHATKIVAQAEHMVLQDGLLYHINRMRNRPDSIRLQLVVPPSLRASVLALCHDSNFHLGTSRTYARVQQNYFWPRYYEDTYAFVASCTKCYSFKNPHTGPQGLVMSQPTYFLPFDSIAMDYFGPLPPTKSGNTSILTIVDSASKFLILVATPDQTAATTAAALIHNVFLKYGSPRRILTDRGANFRSQLLRAITDIFGSHRVFTTPYHPRADGLAERQHQTYKDLLGILLNERQSDWDEYLDFLAFALNTTPQASVQETPFYLNHGRDPHQANELAPTAEADAAPDYSAYRAQVTQRLHFARELAEKNNQNAQERNLLRNNRRRKHVEFLTGEIVYYYEHSTPKGLKPKLTAHWRGPYRIIAQTSPVNYKIALCNNPRRTLIVNVESLRRPPVRPPRLNPPTPLFDVAPSSPSVPNQPPASSPPTASVSPLSAPTSSTASATLAAPKASSPPPSAATSSSDSPNISKTSLPRLRSDRDLSLLKISLSDIYNSVKDRQKVKMSVFRTALKVLLGPGSAFITSSTRNAQFSSRINALNDIASLQEFLARLLENFDAEFAYELG